MLLSKKKKKLVVVLSKKIIIIVLVVVVADLSLYVPDRFQIMYVVRLSLFVPTHVMITLSLSPLSIYLYIFVDTQY